MIDYPEADKIHIDLMQFAQELRQPLVSGSVCCGAELIKFNTYGYDECADCGKTYRQQTDR